MFDQFISEYHETHPDEIEDMIFRLRAMNEKTGIREHFFKLSEGRADDGVAAYYDLPSKNLRLYCILFGELAVIFGGGGIKPKSARTYQELPLLNKQVERLQKISALIYQNIKSRNLTLDKDGNFTGDTILDSYEE